MKLNGSPLVSIVIPVYKVEKYLQASVNSAINQTYSNIEIILVDDGSPDRCPEICDEFASEFRNVSVIHKKNGGLSDARNFGLDKAKGEFILFLDSDDTLVNNAIEELLKKAINNHADMVIPDRYTLVKEDENNSTQLIFHFSNSYFIQDPVKFALDVMVGKGRAWRAHSLLYRTALIKDNNIKFPVGYIAEDIPFNLAALSKASKIAFYENTTVNYLKRAGSITTSFQENLDEVFLFIDKEVGKFLNEVNLDNSLGELKRNELLCRNMISYILSIFSKKCDWSREKRRKKVDSLLENKRVKEAFSLDRITPYTDKMFSRNNMKAQLYKVIFKLIKAKKNKSAFLIAELAGKTR